MSEEAEQPLTEREARAVETALEQVSDGAYEPAEVVVHEDETKEMRTPGFSRMRVNWHASDAQMINEIKKVADDRVLVHFADAYAILNDLYEIVREPECDADGVIVLDRHGWPVWARNESGMFIEDYSRLGVKERERFVFQITTRMFDWEQRAADAWAEAMFSKAQWEERFSLSFFDTTEGGRKTDEAMTQRGRLGSREERYFALFQSFFSRKCEALVRSMDRISLRLSQTYTK